MCSAEASAALSTAAGVMGSLQQQLVAGLLALLLFGTLQAHAQIVVNAAATVADIQAKINAAADNTAQTIIQVAGGIVVGTLPAGTTDMGSSWIKLDKRGVTLRGSTDPSNPTIFQTNITTLGANGGGTVGTVGSSPPQRGSCLADSEGIPMLQVCQAHNINPTGATAFPTIIENIVFKNTDPTPYQAPFGTEKGEALPTVLSTLQCAVVWLYLRCQGQPVAQPFQWAGSQTSPSGGWWGWLHR